MNKHQVILLVDDDPAITEGLSIALERPGRTTIVCADVEAAELLLLRYPVTHVVTDVQFTGDFGFEGLHFLGRVRALAPTCRIVLMTGQVTDPLVRTAKTFGASEVLAKPFDIDELEQALDASNSSFDRAAYEIIRFPSFDEIMGGAELTTVFQPILRLAPGGVETFGYEALTRVYGSWLPGGPELLFEYARRVDRLAELNLLTIRKALEAATTLPGSPVLFINVDPLVFTTPGLVPALKAASHRHGISLSRVVLEVTERSGFENDDRVAGIFEGLRKLGLRFALDDHASAYSHLAVIDEIRPSFMKISNTFGTDFEQHPTRARIVRHIVALAQALGCETILEGIETVSTSAAAAEANIDFVQGYYYGRPTTASYWAGFISNVA